MTDTKGDPAKQPVVERVARAVYAENGSLRIVAPDDDGKGRYREHQNSQNRMRYIEWEELDADDKDSRLREAHAAIAAMPNEKGVTKRYERLLVSFMNLQAAAQDVVEEARRINAGDPWPLKYRAPYAAINRLSDLLGRQYGLRAIKERRP